MGCEYFDPNCVPPTRWAMPFGSSRGISHGLAVGVAEVAAFIWE